MRNDTRTEFAVVSEDVAGSPVAADISSWFQVRSAAPLGTGEAEKAQGRLTDLSEHWIPVLCVKPGHRLPLLSSSRLLEAMMAGSNLSFLKTSFFLSTSNALVQLVCANGNI